MALCLRGTSPKQPQITGKEEANPRYGQDGRITPKGPQGAISHQFSTLLHLLQHQLQGFSLHPTKILPAALWKNTRLLRCNTYE